MPDAPLGATVVAGGVDFRVWAPEASTVDVGGMAMQRQPDGCWFAHIEGAGDGFRYAFRLNGTDAYPDPYSRFQPEGVHGPSQVVDPAAFQWHDQAWPGLRPQGLVIYECHIGTFTLEGTFDAAIDKLPYLQALGITAFEIMPLAEFSGLRNWGYDGVDWFAVTRAYGGPEGLRRLVDAAHQAGIGVLLDVVYNHFGPEGNYLGRYSPAYFTDKYHTPWGGAINYEGCPFARRLALDNAQYWLRELHIDGLRCDATFAIHDASPKHLLRELGETVRAENPRAILIAETHENDVKYLQPAASDSDAVWADDFHHVVRRLVAGDHEGYFADYRGTVEELAQVLNQGFLYEGQRSAFSGQPRGSPARAQPAWQFVYCIQNHDQVGNRAFGDRLSADVSPELYAMASALLLLAPYTPMLFMGQEFAASTPFQYFTDHSPDLGKLVTEGRRKEFASFATFASDIPDPQAESTFEASKLDWSETSGSATLTLCRELLRLRREDPLLAAQDRFAMRASVPAHGILQVDYAGQRLLLANVADAAATVPAAALELLLTTGPQPVLRSDEIVLPARTLALFRLR